jgi:hypothetical protein
LKNQRTARWFPAGGFFFCADIAVDRSDPQWRRVWDLAKMPLKVGSPEFYDENFDSTRINT